MKALIIATILLGLLLFGCVGQITGESKAQCTQQLNACQNTCDNKGYWLASDIENCKGRCSTEYNTCLSH